MNVTHSFQIVGQCPVDGSTDVYDLMVETSLVISVEEILAAARAACREPRYQEDVTAEIAAALPDATRVVTTGVHSGVTTICTVEKSEGA